MQTFDTGINKEEKSHHPQQKCFSLGRQALRNGQRTSCPFSSRTGLQKEKKMSADALPKNCTMKQFVFFMGKQQLTHLVKIDLKLSLTSYWAQTYLVSRRSSRAYHKWYVSLSAVKQKKPSHWSFRCSLPFHLALGVTGWSSLWWVQTAESWVIRRHKNKLILLSISSLRRHTPEDFKLHFTRGSLTGFDCVLQGHS